MNLKVKNAPFMIFSQFHFFEIMTNYEFVLTIQNHHPIIYILNLQFFAINVNKTPFGSSMR